MNKIISDIRQIIRYWWGFLVSGTALIFFGLFVIAHPAGTYAALSFYFTIAFLLNGVLEISFALINRRALRGWGWHLSGGLFDLAIGVLLVSDPVIAATAMSWFAGFWLLFRSISIIGRSFDLPLAEWQERLWMFLLGLAALVFSFMILYNPVLGAFTLVTWTALALISVGLFYIYLGVHLRKFRGNGQV
jgi:uncharacterized membrane protein HdeD (DUF308 family)